MGGGGLHTSLRGSVGRERVCSVQGTLFSGDARSGFEPNRKRRPEHFTKREIHWRQFNCRWGGKARLQQRSKWQAGRPRRSARWGKGPAGNRHMRHRGTGSEPPGGAQRRSARRTLQQQLRHTEQAEQRVGVGRLGHAPRHEALQDMGQQVVQEALHLRLRPPPCVGGAVPLRRLSLGWVGEGREGGSALPSPPYIVGLTPAGPHCLRYTQFT